MNELNFKSSLRGFLKSYDKGDFNDAFAIFNNCIELDGRATIKFLLEKKRLFDIELVQFMLNHAHIPNPFRLLFSLIEQNQRDILKIEMDVTSMSMLEILQGISYWLEKDIAIKKLSSPAEEVAVRVLEMSRQAYYSNMLGIGFQEFLKRYYHKVVDNKTESNIISDSNFKKFVRLVNYLLDYHNINDAIERYAYLNWELNIIDDTKLSLVPGDEDSEGHIKNDIIKQRKAKASIENLSPDELIKNTNNYLNTIQNTNQRNYIEYDLSFEEQNATSLIDIEADEKVNQEYKFFRDKYFPGSREIMTFPLADGTSLNVLDALKVVSYLAILSKKKLTSILDTISTGNSLDYKSCLSSININKFINIQAWLHGFDKEYILKILHLFIFNGSEKDFVNTKPFFQIDNQLFWLQYQIAYMSIAEALMENLIDDKIKMEDLENAKLISIDRKQTKVYEPYINGIFKTCGFKIIEDPKDKIYYKDNKQHGDFDVLAYKDGILIFMELKLTTNRNSIFERVKWKNGKLAYGKDQVIKGKEYISNNLDHIRKILGLEDNEPLCIENCHYFILSNSYLFDHEKIGQFKKVSYFEVVATLLELEKKYPAHTENVQAFLNSLEHNFFWDELCDVDSEIFYADYNIGKYTLSMPSSY
jgi:hypothetical protein